jgi:DNA-directed RNA polymerase
MMKSAEDRQVDLELEQTEIGVKRYRKEFQKATEKGQETSLLPQRIMLVNAIPTISKALKEMFNTKQSKDVRFRKPRAVKLLETIDPDVTAYITTSEIINSISTGRSQLETEMGIARGIKDHLMMKEFKRKTPNLYDYAIDKVNRSTHRKYKRNSLRHYANYAEVESTTSKHDSVLMGVYLLELFIKETGLVTKKIIHSKGKKKAFLKASPEVLQFLNDKNELSEILQPWLLPMIVPPYIWTDGADGGYRTHRMPFIKKATFEECQQISESHDFSTVYKAVNAIQNTAWKINRVVLDVLMYYWISQTETVALPGRIEKEVLPLPCLKEEVDEFKKTHEKEWLNWKKENTAAYTHNENNKSKRVTVVRKIWMAHKLRNEEELYFPHNVDFRGRVYPVVPMLNPQSDDLGKALLKFACGEEIGEDGERWLKIHLANAYGIDKESIDDRLKWTDENTELILKVAEDPHEIRSFWETADSPWQFLAACFEYKNYLDSGLGAKFVSDLPVGFDGTCSGIQHFSAILRDEVVGASVNLVPQDKPADVYQQVADSVNEKLKVSDNPLARRWMGKVNRKLVKSQVMTLPYGATFYGMQDQLREYISKQDMKGNTIITIEPGEEAKKVTKQLIIFITRIIWESIEETLTSTVKAMDWLKSIAKICSDNDMHLEWETPAGFHVKQLYFKRKSYRIDTNFNSIRIQRQLQNLTDELDKRKQCTSFSPNMVHSMDAAHMMNTVNRLVNKGINDFSMVHDSFAVHIGHATTLANELRETFIEQYKDGFIELFHKQLEQYTGLELPKPPKLGNLDINQIRHSDYFFN